MQRRKKFSGVVSSDKMDKTVVVTTTTTKRHPRYGKVIKVHRKFYAHDEQNELKIGDEVEIEETRPLSKLKCWRARKINTTK